MATEIEYTTAPTTLHVDMDIELPPVPGADNRATLEALSSAFVRGDSEAMAAIMTTFPAGTKTGLHFTLVDGNTGVAVEVAPTDPPAGDPPPAE